MACARLPAWEQIPAGELRECQRCVFTRFGRTGRMTFSRHSDKYMKPLGFFEPEQMCMTWGGSDLAHYLVLMRQRVAGCSMCQVHVLHVAVFFFSELKNDKNAMQWSLWAATGMSRFTWTCSTATMVSSTAAEAIERDSAACFSDSLTC